MRSTPDLAPMWWMRISVVSAQGPPTRPWFARNSLMILALWSLPSSGADFVMNLLQGASLAVVFVVAADPELEPVALVAAFRRPVEDRVVAHQELDPAAPGRIGLVDVAVVQNEDAEAEALGQVPDDVGAGLPRVTGGDRWQLLEHRLGPLPRLLLAAGEAEVGVELTVGRRPPGEAPAHPLLERLQRLERGL